MRHIKYKLAPVFWFKTGNVDYERFFTDVIQPLQRNKDFSYRPFDCRIWDLGTPVTVKATPITVIEGSYACHPSLFKYYDLRILILHFEALEKLVEERDKKDGPELQLQLQSIYRAYFNHPSTFYYGLVLLILYLSGLRPCRLFPV